MLDCNRNKKESVREEDSYFHCVLFDALSVDFFLFCVNNRAIVCSAVKIHLQEVWLQIVPIQLHSKSSLDSSTLTFLSLHGGLKMN